jgi:hypothetical protein
MHSLIDLCSTKTGCRISKSRLKMLDADKSPQRIEIGLKRIWRDICLAVDL